MLLHRLISFNSGFFWYRKTVLKIPPIILVFCKLRPSYYVTSLSQHIRSQSPTPISSTANKTRSTSAEKCVMQIISPATASINAANFPQLLLWRLIVKPPCRLKLLHFIRKGGFLLLYFFTVSTKTAPLWAVIVQSVSVNSLLTPIGKDFLIV